MNTAFPLRTVVMDCRIEPGPMTVARAHREMQRHLDCSVDTCRVRRRARAVLVREGAMTLDDRALP